MKQIRLYAFIWLILSTLWLTTAFGHHRTGDLALPELMVAGDFNEDGNLDLAVNVTGYDVIAIFSGDGHGSLSLVGHVPADTLPEGLAAGDVNRDGHLDLVAVNQWGYTLFVYTGDGLGGFTRRKEMNAEGEANRALLGDFNRDGWLDIVANAPVEAKILLYPSNGTGGFVSEEIEVAGFRNPGGIAAADINRDGTLDLVVLDSSREGDLNQALILLGDGKGAFVTTAELPTATAPADVQIADLNGDGKLDLLVVGAMPTSHTGNFVSTYLGDGTGQFQSRQTTSIDGNEVSGKVAVADFNEDGKADVAIPNLTEVDLFFGDGNGNLVARPPIILGTDPQSAISADFNNDGHVDLAVSIRTDGTVAFLLGDGQGGFTVSTVVSVVCPTCLEQGESVSRSDRRISEEN
jgi:FG-GAP-like repeat